MAGLIRLALVLIGKVFFIQFIVSHLRLISRRRTWVRERASQVHVEANTIDPADPDPSGEWDGIAHLVSGEWNWRFIRSAWGGSVVMLSDPAEPRNQIHAHAGEDFVGSPEQLEAAARRAFRRDWVADDQVWSLEIGEGVLKVVENATPKQADVGRVACFMVKPNTHAENDTFPWVDLGLVPHEELIVWFRSRCRQPGHGA